MQEHRALTSGAHPPRTRHRPEFRHMMTSQVFPTPFGSFNLPPPWSTEPVDSLICALDARNVGVPEIVRRVKKQFPSLKDVAIPVQVVEKRILILDQICEIDYFKAGLGIDGREIEAGVGESGGVKHGLLIHKAHGEEWEEKGAWLIPISEGLNADRHFTSSGLAIMKSPKKAQSTESFQVRKPADPDSGASGRGARLGLSIHKNHSQQRGKPSTHERSRDLFDSVHPPIVTKPMIELHENYPTPPSPARSDVNGRPPAVEHSLRKMRSFNEDSPSRKQQYPAGIVAPKKDQLPVTAPRLSPSNTPVHISPFPKIPEHQQTVQQSSVQALPTPPSSGKKLTLKKSNLSLGRPGKGKLIQKKTPRNAEMPLPPLIHVTKPSQESTELLGNAKGRASSS